MFHGLVLLLYSVKQQEVTGDAICKGFQSSFGTEYFYQTLPSDSHMRFYIWPSGLSMKLNIYV